MGKVTHRLKNAFKSKETLEIEGRMKFNQNKRAFAKYYQELDASIKSYSKMARDAELSGNHANARACISFVLKLQKTQVKVQGLLQRFEMMYSMVRLSGVMSRFMNACADMGFTMDENIDLKSIGKSTMAMDKALSKLDMMSDQMDQVFDTIDSGMNSNGDSLLDSDSQDAEIDAMLDRVMGRYNAAEMPSAAHTVPMAQASQAVPSQPAASSPMPESSAADDIDERLRRMMQELKE